ncbi:hypothetical protein F5B21DRAFT_460436 [Xylaria acuta]|nr:hypothetical protein F5B21DRAFT_460436 [Xylaria acuta]
MAAQVAPLEDPETFLSKVFEILDSYDFDRFHEVFATSLEYQGGLQKDEGLETFTQNLKKQMQIMPSMKTSHSRFKNDVTNGTIYSSGTSTAIFNALPDSPSVTIPMIGRFDIVTDGPEAFIQKLPGMAK